ncbi:DUF3499 domain-containing protein [Boudabousia marimammalium]|uniref:DUF3499 domain-containing protein n=1 Tax=Boudabousia marimammalium TaxID=156892 RepID=A0A1Q5PRL0_9ACTO|nr:DUF3499 domain-containing protein [Boudabousia marimammalium]OKL50211.1 hypothetical protein BM477_02115 [Boudabousia marimammalium]
MSIARICAKPGCSARAAATLTYDYGDSTAVIGPLSSKATPRGYDLCSTHAVRFTAPAGWQVVRLVNNFTDVEPTDEEFEELSEAVREAAMRAQAITRQSVRHSSAGRPAAAPKQPAASTKAGGPLPGKRHGYLRVVEGEGQ